MNIDELIEELEHIKAEWEREHDGEQAHLSADRALLRFIDSSRVSELHTYLAMYYS